MDNRSAINAQWVPLLQGWVAHMGGKTPWAIEISHGHIYRINFIYNGHKSQVFIGGINQIIDIRIGSMWQKINLQYSTIDIINPKFDPMKFLEPLEQAFKHHHSSR